MNNNTKKLLLTCVVLSIAIALGIFIDKKFKNSVQHSNENTTNSEEFLDISFIDVGQGLSVLVKYNNDTLLYDAGTPSSDTAILEELKYKNVKKLNYMILSHPHADHIGSAAKILDKIPVDLLLMSKLEKNELPTTATYKNLLKSIEKNKINAKIAKDNESYEFGGKNSIKIIKSGIDDKNYNNKSIVTRIDIGNNKLLLTGDAEDELLETIANNPDIKNIDVVQVPHHGSSSSLYKPFWKNVKPKYGIVSAGKDNKYMHPHKEMLELYKELDVNVLRTDKLGTIRMKIYSDKIVIE